MTRTISAALRRGPRIAQNSGAGLLAASALVGAIACGGSDSGTGPGNRDPVGLYGLRNVDSKAMPVEVFRGPYYNPQLNRTFDPFSITVNGGELILARDGSCRLALDLSTNIEGDEYREPLAGEGYYEIEEAQITLQLGQNRMTGRLRNGDITLGIELAQKLRQYTFRHAP